MRKIEWADSLVHINVDRQKVKDSPTYDTPLKIDQAYARRFNNYYADVIS